MGRIGTPIPRAVLGDQRDVIQEPLAPAENQGGSDYEVTGPQAGPGISVSARAARCGSHHTPIESPSSWGLIVKGASQSCVLAQIRFGPSPGV